MVKGIKDYTAAGGTTVTNNAIAGGNTELLYTRDGNLTLDKDGNLLTSDGRRVMGYLVTVTDEEVTKSKVVSATSSLDENGDALFVNADAIGGTSKKSALVAGTKLQPLKIPDTVKKVVPDATTGAIAIASSATLTTQPVKKFEIGSDGLITASFR